MKGKKSWKKVEYTPKSYEKRRRNEKVIESNFRRREFWIKWKNWCSRDAPMSHKGEMAAYNPDCFVKNILEGRGRPY